MSQLKIDQAFLTSWIATNSEFGLPTAYENKDFSADPELAYAEVFLIQNALDMQSVNDTDETTGIFRAILRYPVNAGAIAAKTKAQEIIDAFSIGTNVSYSGQSVIITKTSRQKALTRTAGIK